jgi:5'-nucleotidase
MKKSVKIVLGALLAATAASCQTAVPQPGAEGDDVGNVAVALAGTGVAGFQIDVVPDGGGAPVSRFIAASQGGPIEGLFVVKPGGYAITQTPSFAANMPDTTCTPSSGHVVVEKGKTSTIVLVARCHGPEKGAVGVTVVTNHEPEILSVGLSLSRPAAPCEPITATVDATDPEGETLTYSFVASGPTAGSTSFAVDVAGNQGTFRATAAGDYSLDVRACDAGGCASLIIPIHVAGDAGQCSSVCDDANPCTTDTRGDTGVCAHAPVADGSLCTGGKLKVKVLGFNDFHGHLQTDVRVSNRLVGGAAVLASYLRAAQSGIEDQTIIVHAGDFVGASPPDSALLQDEPSIQWLNLLTNASCTYADKLNPTCNVVGTPGNHEFDEGKGEMLRLIGGGNFGTGGPFLEDPWKGARFPYVAATVVDSVTHEPFLPPYVVKTVKGVPVAFIGALLKQTPTIVTPAGVAGLSFLDEADAINSYVPELKAMGVRSIIVTIHQGGFQSSYTGATRDTATLTSGPEITDIVRRLDSEIDVVVAGHTHAFNNVRIANDQGKSILVTQAFSGGTAYDDVDLLIDPVTRDIVQATSQVVTTFADAGPGLTPDPMVAAIANAALNRVGPLVNRVVGSSAAALNRTASAAGESSLGDLIADAQRAATGTQLAFMNPGGIRQDLDAGPITWGELFAIQPFGNSLVTMNMTGQQIYTVLEQQWSGANQASPRVMQISGFSYTWDPLAAPGARVLEVRIGGVAIDRAATYTVTCNNFMAGGGDNFIELRNGANQTGGDIDLDALVEYIEHNTPIAVPAGGRIVRYETPAWIDRSAAAVNLAVFGDTPYGAVQIADMPNFIASVNADPTIVEAVHLGDIKNGSTACNTEYFQFVLDGFNQFTRPLIYTPGDNEWTDCHRANNGAYDPLERLSTIRSMFYPAPGQSLGAAKKQLFAQSTVPGFSTFVENTMWFQAGAVFATLHVVGSNDSLLPWFTDAPAGSMKVDDPARRTAEVAARQAATLDWLTRAFATATSENAKSVILLMQADMWDALANTTGFNPIIQKIAQLTLAFGKPVLLMQGDSHLFKVDNPLAAGDAPHGVATPVPNLTRLVVQGSTTTTLTEWLRLRVDPAATPPFSWTRVAR